ncbi:MAG: HD domain-containing protein [Clostridiales Family XIII bacterium]|jgi:3'-5' exoribonuclease|nr:HD domain-containing protein [Clostridiales Family XIII bacterium]
MKQKYVADIVSGEEFADFFLVKRAEIKTGSNSKQYFDVLLADKTGEISGKKWDADSAEVEALQRIAVGGIVKIKASVTEWNGANQLRITRIRPSTEGDALDRIDFVRAAPETPTEMFDFIYGKAQGLSDADYRETAAKLLSDNKERLLYYPAAKANHHAIFGGLLYHVKRMLMMAERCCEVYTFLNRDLLLCGVIVHDIEKLNEMDADENGTVTEYTLEGQLLGHLIMGVRTIDRLADEIGLPNEKAVMLEHMMISHHYEPDFGSPKRPLFPEAEALHYMDMIDAKLYDFEEALSGVRPGHFSDWIRTLDGRKLYRAQNAEDQSEQP